MSASKLVVSTLLSWLVLSRNCEALPLTRSTTFFGQNLNLPTATDSRSSSRCILTMRKQKASDKRTRRRQRGEEAPESLVIPEVATLTASPMAGQGWKRKTAESVSTMPPATGGRGRSRKRSTLYNTLSYYHNTFLHQLTSEYQAEEEEVMGRIKASLDDPIALETAGYALFDMYPERRGNLYSDEVYRITKAKDATTTYPRDSLSEDDETAKPFASTDTHYLPPNHKFGGNDVIMLTLQPNGSGDFFSAATLPTNDAAVSIEARVLNLGPTYLDIAVSAGAFEAAFGAAPNDNTSKERNRNCRLRADRFFSEVPYQRMVAALSAITNIPDRSRKTSLEEGSDEVPTAPTSRHANINMDELLREVILSTHAFEDPGSPFLHDPSVCNLQELANSFAKPPMASSPKLALQVMKHMKANPNGVFRTFNAPQRAAIEAALTRRLTMIQGPPGTGKTTVGSAIAFGFVHQCRTLSPHTKVLACAFSNVGADNLADACLALGLRVVRVGRPSAVTESLWDCTLDAAIDRDPVAQKALRNAAQATAQLASLSRKKGKSASSSASDRVVRDAATIAVKASIKASNIAATKAMREADVIVSTSTGASDPRLMAACGIPLADSDDEDTNKTMRRPSATSSATVIQPREDAPDGLPPLSMPFVLVDEACQSVEPATLIPIVSSNSCRSLVLLGDPCQLPPTVRSRQASGLALSLMERLAATLPHPTVIPAMDDVVRDTSFLDTPPIRNAKSLVCARSAGERKDQSYRKRFAGSLLLSIQYRMHPSIAAFPSAIFYDGLLSTPSLTTQQRKFPDVLSKLMPSANTSMCTRLIDVGGRGNERQGLPTRYARSVASSSASAFEEQTSYWNEPEAERVLSIIKDILRDPDRRQVSTIGVITPYNAQVQLIKSMISGDSDLRGLLQEVPTTIEVKSVDGYQGRERDVILFSAVRSNRQGNIGFLHDWRRMNVALTRPKSALLVLGDFETLSEADKHWAALYQWGSEAGCVVEGDAPDQ